MFEKFPPMNGEYALSDEIAYASEDTENHLTDYSFWENGVYCAFAYNVATEVLKFLKNTAEQYGMGVYNLATGEIFCKNLDILKYSTESIGDTLWDWKTIENSIATLDNPERGINLPLLPSGLKMITQPQKEIIFNAHQIMYQMVFLPVYSIKMHPITFLATFLK